MNKIFLDKAIEKLNFPQEAREEIFSLVKNIEDYGYGKDLDGIVSAFIDGEYASKNVNPEVLAFAEKINITKYALWLLICLLAMESAMPIWQSRGRDEELFWHTFEDITFKARKCKNIYGVWGLFVPYWYRRFYNANIVRFGCFEFEDGHYKLDEPYICGGITVNKGDAVKGLHIPASGLPFDREGRVSALKEAYGFFKDELKGKPLVCQCHSWILYPDYKELYPVGSNLRSFFEEFDILYADDHDHFGDIWRVFGKDKDKPYAELPENTSLQRAFKSYLLNGGKYGEGFGMFVFDGEKIITLK